MSTVAHAIGDGLEAGFLVEAESKGEFVHGFEVELGVVIREGEFNAVIEKL